MKKTLLLIGICFLTLSCVNAQWGNGEKVKGNGDMVTKSRSTETYDEINLVGSMNVQLVAGKEGTINIEAESNLHEYILTEVKNGVLRISTEDGYNLSPREDILITVPFESLEAVSLTGSGDIRTKDKINSSNMQVQVTGSGDIKLELEVTDLEGIITGSGDVKLKGSSRNFDCKVTGSGDFDAYELLAENVEAKVSGSGDIMVNAKNSLKASVSGSGDIVYKGNPEKQDFNSHGSGEVSSY
ncbi:MAG: DUF2807 domain-containing protein [Gramella sp.]|nr:DUF2807 domain-containing protein [Christiangramia sp.]